MPQTRTPDAHFYTEARYKGAKSVVICPDYSEASKFADLWISRSRAPTPRSAWPWAMSSCSEFHVDRQAQYFQDYARQYTDMPMLVRLVKQEASTTCRSASAGVGFRDKLGEANNPEWKTVAYDEATGESWCRTALSASAGARRASGISRSRPSHGQRRKLRLSLAGVKMRSRAVGFPYFGNREHDYFMGTDHPDVLLRNVPVKTLQLAEGETLVATVFDLFLANYGVDRGFGGGNSPGTMPITFPTRPPGASDLGRAARPGGDRSARVRA